MSKDKKIHNLIEQQSNNSKEESWKKIENQLSDSSVSSSEINAGGNTKALLFSKKVIAAIVCSVVVLIAAILLIVLLPKSDGNPRFLGSDEYTIESTENTLKDYAGQAGNDFLYFDWYEETEYENSVVKSNISDEIFCYQETITDMETGYQIILNITDLRTDIDVLSKYKECHNIHIINGTEIKWSESLSSKFATFDYKEHRYYVEVPECESPEILLGYIEQLLS